jgi:ribonuclease T
LPPKIQRAQIANRFRGFLPVVVDVETSGLNPATDALLEMAVVPLALDEKGIMYPMQTHAYHIEPFIGAHFDPEALAITGIDPTYPLRFAIPEQHALHLIFKKIEHLLSKTGCQRAVWVGHNSWFDLAFIQSAVKRCYFRKVPYHSFTTFDTATLAAIALGETVLAKALRAVHIPFDITQAHSAIYDAEQTAKLFCYIVNHFKNGFSAR